MGIHTTIYTNHNLTVPTQVNEIIELLKQTWKDQIEFFDGVDTPQHRLTSDANSYKIFINPKLIAFEVERFGSIRICTSFNLTMSMQLYKNTFCVTPSGIGKYSTQMIAEFMNKPFGIYTNNSESFNHRKKDWNKFKIFLANITSEIGGDKHLYLNDGQLDHIGYLSRKGKTLDEMISMANNITKPCSNAKEFVELHTQMRQDGISIIKDDVWFVRELNH